jgi:hypothetical protein
LWEIFKTAVHPVVLRRFRRPASRRLERSVWEMLEMTHAPRHEYTIQAPILGTPCYALRDLCRTDGRPAGAPQLDGSYVYWQQLSKSGVLRHWIATCSNIAPSEVGIRRLGARWYLSAATVAWLTRQPELPSRLAYLRDQPDIPGDADEARRLGYRDPDSWVAAQPLAALRAPR